MGYPLFHVDAFTHRPLSGNPAAVCILPAWRADQWHQAVAKEMNLSETAFLVKQPGHFDLRWFTPAVEVDLCGHATLASTHILWQQGQATSDEIRFSTRSGICGRLASRWDSVTSWESQRWQTVKKCPSTFTG
ncbi:MAG TPA: PhzF family phenazine biosynthesis isomerase [Gemmataceae bacterium]|nr:PhzF family phenazine biosynthesis isomerase [Gemmataceae bacterium]